jgi:hypothetical protein
MVVETYPKIIKESFSWPGLNRNIEIEASQMIIRV